jgi:integrase
MALTMTQPTRHSKTGIFRVRLTIPADLRPTAKQFYGTGTELIANLATRDKREALARAPAALAKLKAKLDLVRALHADGPKHLTHREVRAIAGEWYREAVGMNEDNPGPFEGWDAERDDLLGARTFPDGDPDDGRRPDYAPDRKALEEARAVLAARKTVATDASVEALAVALWEARLHFSALMMRRAQGDYGPDSFDTSLPSAPASPSPDFGPSATFDEIVRGWAIDAGHDPEAKPVHRAWYDRHRTAERLAAFLGHRFVIKVAKADAVRWKESIQAGGKSAATVANDISEMSAVWKWAMAHGKAEQNPFAGILPPKKARNRKAKRRPFTTEEAVAILTAARKEHGALRWLPWVLAATGARLSEVCQGTKDDLILRDGLPFLRIHADDDDDRAEGEGRRSVKNEGSERMVPIHPMLQAEGFLSYVAALPARSSLFPDIPPDKVFGSRGTSAQRIVRRWLRSRVKIVDTKISPSHSWRHWWIDQARAAGMHPEVRNAITGHVDDDNESHRYGHGWKALPKALADAMDTITLPDELSKNRPNSILPAA